VFYVRVESINSRSTIMYMKSEIFVLTTASQSLICYVHLFTSSPLSVYVLFYITFICAYIFYLVYFILLIFLFCPRMHQTYILLFIHECLHLLYFQVFMRSNSLAFLETFTIVSLHCKRFRSHNCLRF
jgi:hypothetical protein